jgi:ABC-type multidrug transport system fused ATPase/permease subunit
MCKESQDKLSEPRRWPEERHVDRNWFSLTIDRWTFRYMNDILDRGKIRDDVPHLTHDDLFPVPSTMRAEFLSQQFRSLYYQHRDKKERQLITTLWKMAAPTFLPAGVCQLITVACQVALPLLVRELLQVLEENPKQEVISEGLPYALALFFTSVLNAFGNHRHRHLAMKSGIVMRAALINVLYQHVLQLTPKGRAGLTSGEVTNLLAVDTQKLYEVAQEGHLVWSLPLTVILVTYFLVRTLGWSALVGVATLVLFVPIVERVTAAMMSIRSERVKYTDRRIEISTAMLQGVSQKFVSAVSDNHELNSQGIYFRSK